VVTLALDVPGIDLDRTLGSLHWLPGDPTIRLAPGRFQRATATPEGPGGLVITGTGQRAATAAGAPRGWPHDIRGR
jgi:hypothetical protein